MAQRAEAQSNRAQTQLNSMTTARSLFGRVSLYDDHIRIRRYSVLYHLRLRNSQNSNTREIPYRQIRSVKFRRASGRGYGFIQFMLNSDDSVPSSLVARLRDDLTLIFFPAQQQDFEGFKETLKERLTSFRTFSVQGLSEYLDLS